VLSAGSSAADPAAEKLGGSLSDTTICVAHRVVLVRLSLEQVVVLSFVWDRV